MLRNFQLKETHFQGSGPGLLSALVESLRFVALPPVAAHISHNIATLGGSLENKSSMSVETQKKAELQVVKRGLIQQESFESEVSDG